MAATGHTWLSEPLKRSSSELKYAVNTHCHLETWYQAKTVEDFINDVEMLSI